MPANELMGTIAQYKGLPRTVYCIKLTDSLAQYRRGVVKLVS